ncbi:type II toxin-antitoxin system RelE/ParE family toxin [Rhizobiales bacterium]|uniref:type II toxin-antitoxin system RelE/ParE family toxin n=1 Tax=Hongsoonwoonella zoysiae TaxID=2821844 RepID=UPI001560D2BA|nr:type II toxin-antitoxin system RelE/ParE family toxin [Hongsoonwoonella zoysiae]NRG16471.1 type II toxin-antitoxin system RelE/ParE family toxin [Hongsoonwoonella zoysiae]
MLPDKRKFPAYFLRLTNGREPVRDWLKTLSKDDRLIVDTQIEKLEFGEALGLKYGRHIGGGLFELRSYLAGGRFARIFYSLSGRRLVLIHGVTGTSRIPAEVRRFAKTGDRG